MHFLGKAAISSYKGESSKVQGWPSQQQCLSLSSSWGWNYTSSTVTSRTPAALPRPLQPSQESIGESSLCFGVFFHLFFILSFLKLLPPFIPSALTLLHFLFISFCPQWVSHTDTSQHRHNTEPTDWERGPRRGSFPDIFQTTGYKQYKPKRLKKGFLSSQRTRLPRGVKCHPNEWVTASHTPERKN